MARLGIIAGGGRLPVELAQALTAENRNFFVVRLDGMADQALQVYDNEVMPLLKWGGMVKALRAAGCDEVCLIGNVQRPDYSKMAMDAAALTALPGLLAAGRKGDDALLRQVMSEFEKKGFRVVGAQDLTHSLTLPAGVLGAVAPDPKHETDIDRALSVARAIGQLDVGQGAVVARGLVLAVEAQEGTDRMLARVADLPEAIRGVADDRAGVLAKAPKPMQERRIDLPTIGVATVEGAARAGLAGIVGEARALIVLDRAAVIAAADAAGLFILGVEP